MAVHQLIPSFVAGDAMGQAALHFRALLRRLGQWGEIYAGEVERGLESLARPASALRPRQEDVVLYHHGIASPLAGALLHLPCRRGVVFHNITPSRFYAGTALAEALDAGRAQLAAMAGNVDVAIGVSTFNAQELEVSGHAGARVVPLFVEPRRFAADRARPSENGHAPVLVAVGRAAPHKRLEDVLALHAELRRLEPDARTVFVGPYPAGGAYFRRLAKTARDLGGVEFLGRVSHAELVAAYRSATAYVSMSEHEGFGVPLVEAMAAETPVVAFAAAAVPETLGGAGIAFTEKRFAFLAELVRELGRDAGLRRSIVEGQRRRLGAFSAESAGKALGAALKPLGLRRPGKAKRRRKPRVGILVQRYGEATGGAEAHARSIAHQLSPHWDVTVLTTCAVNHLTWANELEEGESRDGPVRVLRFPVDRPREMRAFNRLSREVFDRSNDRLHEERWLAEQGPVAPELFEHLVDRREQYDGFVAFTSLYVSTAWGLPLVADRALLVPTVHDEPPMKLGLYDEVLAAPRALLCNTPEEQAFIRARFPKAARARVVGVGVDMTPGDPERFRRAFSIERPYLLYVGRIEAGKGIPELLDFYSELRGAGLSETPELLLAGSAQMEVVEEGVRLLGRISEADKRDAIAGAAAVVVPSQYESLSLLALEAFAQGTPVVVNGRSDVLTGQSRRSGAGVAYTDVPGFVDGVEHVRAHRRAMSARARRYAAQHSWKNVIEAYREEMGRILEKR